MPNKVNLCEVLVNTYYIPSQSKLTWNLFLNQTYTAGAKEEWDERHDQGNEIEQGPDDLVAKLHFGEDSDLGDDDGVNGEHIGQEERSRDEEGRPEQEGEERCRQTGR